MTTWQASEPEAGRQPGSARSWVWLLLVPVAAGAAWFAPTWRARNAAPAPVETVPAARADVEDAVTALGKIQPRAFVDVGAQVSGQLTRLAVRAGDQVKAGDLIAQIDPQLQRAKLEVDRAELARLSAELDGQGIALDYAKSRFDRQAALVQEGATSRDLVDQTQWEVRAAAAKLSALQAQVQEARSTLQADETQLNYTRIYAPISGTVVSVEARQGQTLNASTQTPVLLRIADLSQMTVWTQVSEADVTRLRVGMSLYATTLGYGARRWQGTLRQILPAPDRPPVSEGGAAPANNNVVFYTALFDVDNGGGELRPEMSAQVFFVLGSAHDAVVVPITALECGADGSTSVTVVSAQGQRQRRSVTTGVQNRFVVEITSGLQPGEAVQKDHAAPLDG